MKRGTPCKKSGFKEDLPALEQKWSERISQLEALIVAKFIN